MEVAANCTSVTVGPSNVTMNEDAVLFEPCLSG
jgi:hypothetical protein